MHLMFVDESGEESKDDNLRYFQSYLLDQGDRFRKSHIVEGTFFAKSHTSGLLQLADFCSNVFLPPRLERDFRPRVYCDPSPVLAAGEPYPRLRNQNLAGVKKSGQGGFHPTSRTLAAVLVAGYVSSHLAMLASGLCRHYPISRLSRVIGLKGSGLQGGILAA